MSIPEDFLVELTNHGEAMGLFEQLSVSHQREYIKWIEEAKKHATRQSRIQKAIQMILEKSSA
ncbi:MAG: YdeI/OmpD-associated family protein [Gammaproteobacteria bacterium]|nr:YdeI/OmpD-associated family protein [Gammaproteobacteria bacterium]MDH5653746.1 YdeI/OmpD-associated family protein [Gammaproteobacteria bacterium]